MKQQTLEHIFFQAEHMRKHSYKIHLIVHWSTLRSDTSNDTAACSEQACENELKPAELKINWNGNEQDEIRILAHGNLKKKLVEIV